MSKKILIVEDYEDTRSFMKYLLEDKGYQVCEARDGIEAFDRFKQQHPDIILMDIMMPFMDGIETIKLIRDMPEYRSTKIIVTTADDTPAIKLRSQASGADGYLNKPIDVDLLEAMF